MIERHILMNIIKGVYVSLVVNCLGLVGSSFGDLRCRAASVTDHAIFIIGRVVLCSILSAFSSLATLPFLVW